MEREAIQTTLDEFNELRDQDQREALKRIHRTHVSKMESVFNQIFQRLFQQDYIERC
jgi:hypothetical protein